MVVRDKQIVKDNGEHLIQVIVARYKSPTEKTGFREHIRESRDGFE